MIKMVALVEDWTRGLINDLPSTDWEAVGYAKADLLFVLIAAAIINNEIPTKLSLEIEHSSGGPKFVKGSNISGNLSSKESVQRAKYEFVSAVTTDWNSIYERWETELAKKETGLPIQIWRGIASCCAREAKS